MTWVRDPREEPVLRRALTRLAESGCPVAIADRGTHPSFTSEIRSLPGTRVTVAFDPGLVPQVQASLALAAQLDRDYVLYVEPDKDRFFEVGLRAFIEGAPDETDVGVVVAARSPASFATFPPMQQYTETIINTLTGGLTGVAGDYSYGPFLLSRLLLPHLSTLDVRLGWGWRHAAFVAAARAGLRVIHVVGDYPCPLDQRDEDERERRHRMRQLSENLQGLIVQPSSSNS